MPFLTNSIGDHEFLQMDGSFYLAQQQLELIERVGINGTGLRRLGDRGKPFQLITINYEADFDAAEDKMDEYVTLVGDDPVNVIRHGETEGNYFVLSVQEQQPPFAIMSALGGLVGGETCCHIVTWTLLAGP